MNVLVYCGPGTTPNSVKQAVETLRVMLSPHYAVSPVSEAIIRDQPWEAKTAVLVFPGGADLPICKLFNGEINTRIANFVRKGGKYIGFCSGGYYGSGRCEFEVGDQEMEVSGARELKFYPGICRGGAKKGFVYNSEAGAKAVPLNINQSIFPNLGPSIVSYLHGGGMFVDAQKYSNVKVLATYADEIDVVDDTPQGVKAAVVLSTFGRGKALLSGPHIEFSPDLLDNFEGIASFTEVIETLQKENKDRLEFLRSCLVELGLNVNKKVLERPALTPLFLTSLQDDVCERLIFDLEENVVQDDDQIINIGYDRIKIHKSLDDLPQFQKGDPHEDPDTAIKNIYVCGQNLPPLEDTPYFNIAEFQHYLKQFYTETGQLSNNHLTGASFMYGEVLTSTSTLMDRNFQLLKYLPDGFTIFGSTQVSGKGRSGNHWVNPRGVLAVSSLIKLPIVTAQKSSIVFFQYLSAMAYTKAILEYDEKCQMIPVKIKWPNDIYIMLPEYIGKKIDTSKQDVTHAKIGGILVNTNLIGKTYHLVVGAGLNVGNESPTTSLNKVVDAINAHYGESIEHFQSEKLLAKYLSIFNAMIEKFKMTGFKPFLEEYYNLWFHSNQIVTMYDQADMKAQVTGITPDWGMLLVRELNPMGKPTGNVFELQPDGNSFDMFRGLISKKQ